MDQAKKDAAAPQYTEIAPPPVAPGYDQPPQQPEQPGYPPQQPGYAARGYQPGTMYTAAPGYGQPRANMHAYQPLAAQQSSTDVTVVNAQPSTVQYSVGVRPESHMGLSIFTCFCCCWLFGLIAIMYSSQVEPSWSIGDYEGAHRSSRTALYWNIASIMGGILGGVLSAVSVGIYYANNKPD